MMLHTDDSFRVHHADRVADLHRSAAATRRRSRAVLDGTPPGRAAPRFLRSLARGLRLPVRHDRRPDRPGVVEPVAELDLPAADRIRRAA